MNTICIAILKSGKRTGLQCINNIKKENLCGYHLALKNNANKKKIVTHKIK